jgi:hypothetical protein
MPRVLFLLSPSSPGKLRFIYHQFDDSGSHCDGKCRSEPGTRASLVVSNVQRTAIGRDVCEDREPLAPKLAAAKLLFITRRRRQIRLSNQNVVSCRRPGVDRLYLSIRWSRAGASWTFECGERAGAVRGKKRLVGHQPSHLPARVGRAAVRAFLAAANSDPIYASLHPQSRSANTCSGRRCRQSTRIGVALAHTAIKSS